MEIKYKETVTTFGEISLGELFKLTRPSSTGIYIKAADGWGRGFGVNIKTGLVLTDINNNDGAILLRGLIVIENQGLDAKERERNEDYLSNNLKEQKN